MDGLVLLQNALRRQVKSACVLIRGQPPPVGVLKSGHCPEKWTPACPDSRTPSC